MSAPQNDAAPTPDIYPEVIHNNLIWTVHQEGTGWQLKRPGAICHVSSIELAGLPRRSRGKPRGKHGLIPDTQLHVLHAAHIRGTSIRQLGRDHWQTIGAASPHSASMAISYGFNRLGLDTRSRSAATAANNRQRRAEGSPGTGDRAAYKRYLRTKAGGQRPCQGKRTQYPRKGEPCASWAQAGSDFCPAHDPARQQERDQHLAGARSKIGGH